MNYEKLSLSAIDVGRCRIQATKNISEFLRAHLEEKGIAVIG